mmetsp:Transcript_24679/g.40855  ORF Transcript_24679/g.40855 Transcript_24679/m.40855 type:complete len:316 (+) Transcript_24679:1309-2256(+)
MGSLLPNSGWLSPKDILEACFPVGVYADEALSSKIFPRELLSSNADCDVFLARIGFPNLPARIKACASGVKPEYFESPLIELLPDIFDFGGASMSMVREVCRVSLVTDDGLPGSLPGDMAGISSDKFSAGPSSVSASKLLVGGTGLTVELVSSTSIPNIAINNSLLNSPCFSTTSGYRPKACFQSSTTEPLSPSRLPLPCDWPAPFLSYNGSNGWFTSTNGSFTPRNDFNSSDHPYLLSNLLTTNPETKNRNNRKAISEVNNSTSPKPPYSLSPNGGQHSTVAGQFVRRSSSVFTTVAASSRNLFSESESQHLCV